MKTSSRQRRFDAFYAAARHNDVFDQRTTLLLHLAAALAIGCDP